MVGDNRFCSVLNPAHGCTKLCTPGFGTWHGVEQVARTRRLFAVWRCALQRVMRCCRYGNAVNVQRTVRGFATAGFAGILLEDQVAPKSCGHVRGKQVVSRGEAVSRIRAAADARCESGALITTVTRP